MATKRKTEEINIHVVPKCCYCRQVNITLKIFLFFTTIVIGIPLVPKVVPNDGGRKD